MSALNQIEPTRLIRLVEVSRILNSTTNVDELLTFIMDEATELIGSESASILLLDPQLKELRFRAMSGQILPALTNITIPVDSSIAGTVLQSNQPLVVNDVSQDPRWNPTVSRTLKHATHSILCVPMRAKNNPVGVLQAVNKQGGKFQPADVETLGILADLAGTAVEKARLIEALQLANLQLSQLDALKSNFIAIASHELRTPLSIILGYVSFIQEVADPAMASQLDHVLRAATHLRSLIQDMLNLRYVDVGQATLKLVKMDFGVLVAEMIAQRDETAEAKQQTIQFSKPAISLPVLLDRAMMEVVIGNLLNNAIKFTGQGGKIQINLQKRGNEVWLSVLDTGVGIPEEELTRIFDRFYQVGDPLRRSYEGLGLGLAVAKELLELHSGRIWATSKLNEGSQFYIALPLLF